ncbi:substrate-binding domain-containing protein [Streptomyces sp. M2]|uniref:substrate-binding domain-containing protein n=1 Tax=unclassified Streptomyces TaxID=2593676 RepID=UPI00321F8C90
MCNAYADDVPRTDFCRSLDGSTESRRLKGAGHETSAHLRPSAGHRRGGRGPAGRRLFVHQEWGFGQRHRLRRQDRHRSGDEDQQQPQPPTALVAGNNRMTIGAMRALRNAGLKVPGDMALVSFDDFEWADLFHPRLTAMAQPALSIGEQAVSMALSRIASPSLPPRKVTINPTFMHRESAAVPLPTAPPDPTSRQTASKGAGGVAANHQRRGTDEGGRYDQPNRNPVARNGARSGRRDLSHRPGRQQRQSPRT